MFSALTKATLILLHHLVFICVLFDSYGIIDCLLIFARGARKTQEANKLVATVTVFVLIFPLLILR